MMTGLKTFSSKLPCDPATVDLAGHDRRAGLVLGERQLAETAAGPRAEPAQVVGDLHERAGERAEGAARHHEIVVRGERGELVGRRGERQARQLGELRGDGLAEAGRCVESGPDRGAADRQRQEAGQGRVDPRETSVELGDVARELLAERERHRVLQMGAADLHDVVELARLGRERVPQRADARDEAPRQLERGRDVHRGGERIVGRLGHVDVVVRVDRVLAAKLAAGELDRAVRDHLVHVHVGLGARARLPDGQREVVVERAGDHLIGGAHDQLGPVGVEEAELPVDEGRRFLQEAEA